MSEPFPGYDDIAAVKDWLDNHENNCGHVGAIGLLPSGNISAFGKLECIICGAGVGYLPKPHTTQEQKARRPRRTLPRLDEDRCHLCLATRMQAQILGRTLVAHHLIDRALLIEAGVYPDDLKYLAWVCSQACHPIITAMRQATGAALTMAGAFPSGDDTA